MIGVVIGLAMAFVNFAAFAVGGDVINLVAMAFCLACAAISAVISR